jgi:hypothetical protein
LEEPQKSSSTKKGRIISWYYSNKIQKFPPTKPDDDDELDDNKDDITDEKDPKS